jgi:hypothetical protein
MNQFVTGFSPVPLLEAWNLGNGCAARRPRAPESTRGRAGLVALRRAHASLATACKLHERA